MLCFLLAGGAISWMSAKQGLITSSIMEVELVACDEATTQAVQLHDFITGLKIVDSILKPFPIYCDYFATMFFSMNERSSNKSKHIDIILLFRRKWGNKCSLSTSELGRCLQTP